MTFQDYETYDWYLKGVPEHLIVVMDPSELPDKAEEVKFWNRSAPVSGEERWRDAFYAIGEVAIRTDFK